MDLSPLTATQQTATLPSQTGASSSAFSSLTDNIDTFLTLLTTQLQNQNPLDPLDTEQFTQQLVQFASVEQSIQTNTNLETLIALQSSSDRSNALDLIGRSVTVNSDTATLNDGAAEWTYTLPAGAASATLAILDATGAPIATAAGPAAAGTNSFVWDGRTAAGTTAEDGAYRLVVSALDSSGASISSTINTQTSVNAVAFTDEGAQLETPLGVLRLDDVARAGLRISENEQ